MAENEEPRSEFDPVRLLAQRSELAYVDRLDRAVHDEPEAVSEAEQRQISAAAARRDREQRIRAWKSAHRQINEAVSSFKSVCPPRGPVVASLRAIERTAARLDREVAGS